MTAAEPAARRAAPRHGPAALTEREKETLRLLLAGHDAKSIARRLSLSVHTVNERLRDARRKLDATSSREAARMLAEAERNTPETLGDKDLGVPAPTDNVQSAAATARPPWASRRALLIGGSIVMSLVLAAITLGWATHGSSDARSQTAPGAVATDPAAPDSLPTARDWLGLLDRQQWDASWRATAPLIQSRVTSEQWGTMIAAARQPLGIVRARQFSTVTKVTSLPGAPDGRYEILQFRTSFEHKADAVETVTFVRQGDRWAAAGYYIR